ncbi:6-carboxytetrahydropterin synthase [Anaerosporobacter sp.]|uniref:6-carboxytetrahydropterin synthase n=1 Tax=Anaerosporobacter sp. TaxID=1872529 RepID=UPI00286ECEF0|nr:6-carboxytetrahydropterin synthase [Anaerosporobacter sp.]
MGLVGKQLHYYKFKYYFSAQHSMTKLKEDMHPHTFTVVLYIETYGNDNIELFSKVEEFLEEYFSRFTGEKLNDLSCFVREIPTIEAMGEYFYEEVKEKLQHVNLDLIQLEICENPLRIYSISDRIIHCSAHIQNSSRQLKRILEMKQKYL